MSAAPRLARALAAALVAAAVAAPLMAQTPVISARVGGELVPGPDGYVEVPVTVDMTGSLGRKLGGYRMTFDFDQTMASFSQVLPGTFSAPTVNYDSVYTTGTLQITALMPAGADGLVTLFVVRLYLYATTPSAITISFQELVAATSFEDLLPYLTVENGTICQGLGMWGDIDGDQVQNSRDALIALSVVVGLPVDALFNTSLGDVDGDGLVTSRDALIILSYSVGLDVAGFRVGLPAAPSACATGTAVTLVIDPDSIELQTGQRVAPMVRALDATGREVPIGTLVWRSSNSTVAAWMEQYYSDTGIDARDPGIAVLTAELAPGIKDSIKVTVIARRRNWYVDVGRGYNAPIQTGSQRYPFAFIGDALDQDHARDGDTVHVASGVYEEQVSGYVSVTLLGDSISRPILEPRGSPNYYSYSFALYLGTAAARAELAHMVIRGGSVYMEGHDNVVRDVRFEDVGASVGTVLEIYSQANAAAAPPGASRVTAVPPQNLGQVTVEDVVIDGYDPNYAIEIDQADTAIVRNVTITRDSVNSNPYCSGWAITIFEASHSDVRDNVITNAACSGILVEQERGTAVISRNRIQGAARHGIELGLPVSRLDHNVIRDVGTSYQYAATSRGIYVYPYYNSDSVVSVGDSIINVDYRGFDIDSAGVAIIDSLVVDGTGQDSSGSAHGLHFWRGRRLEVTNSRISNAPTTGSIGISAGASRSVVISRGNRVRNTAFVGIYGYDLQVYLSGPDSVLSSNDTVINVGTAGIAVDRSGFARIDSAFVDSTLLLGIETETIKRAVFSNSTVRNISAIGVVATTTDTVSVLGNDISLSGTGVDVYQAVDSVRIARNTIDSGGVGVDVSSGNTVLDSNVIRENRVGLWFVPGTGVSLRAVRTRLEANDTALKATGFAAAPLSIAQSNFLMNAVGVYNGAAAYLTADADSNYWNDALGPRCDSAVTGTACDPASLGDSIVTGGVTFVPFLTAPAAATPAPPSFAARASVRGLSSMVNAPTSAESREAALSRWREQRAALAPEPAPAGFREQRPRPTRRPFPQAWQRGRAPQPPRPPVQLN